MRPAARSRPDARRGLTLVEMLVTVGLLVLVMTILVEIFRSATGAISVSRTFAALDQDLRRVDALLRQDLHGSTARMTPPLNPNDGLGYFTYGENALADLQGEDTDDYLAFTARAPDGEPFLGSVVLPVTGTVGIYNRVQVSSQFAEVVYFLRNGNLYRRVFLIRPDLAPALTVGTDATGTLLAGGGYNANFVLPGTGLYSLPMSWQGLNDISARPSKYGNPYVPVPNTLSDLTNRENRAFSPRFANDYLTASGPVIPDGVPDDTNSDGIPDWYPTMYKGVENAKHADGTGMLYFPGTPPTITLTYDNAAFPYLYPRPYSAADASTANYGQIHTMEPGVDTTTSRADPADSTRLIYPRVFNHAPLDLGERLWVPSTTQTWWGFPTKKETMSQYWTDPVKRINDPTGAPYFTPSMLRSGDPALHPSDAMYLQSVGLSWTIGATINNLPPMTLPWRAQSQPFTDGLGAPTFLGVPVFPASGTPAETTLAETWKALVEEDLILTGVRSFDVKAFDVALSTYADLGYGNYYNGTPPLFDSNGDGTADYYTLQTMAHEGRMPPLTTDYRSDPQWPALNPNVGDDQTSLVRMRRVWDTWSTDYTNTPYQTLNPLYAAPYAAHPTLPSYPAPYPAPLRGLQIQIRVTDPANQRIKLLTIRHDFSDKL